MPQQELEYQDAANDSRDRNARRTKAALIAALAIGAALLIVVVVRVIYTTYEQVWSVKQLFANSADWEVVEVTGFNEMPGYSVTGVLLAAKDRPEATVRLGFNQWTSLRDNREISIVSMKDVDVEDVSERLLSDPRITDRQRTELKFRYYDRIDVKSTGEFANLFPPIRDLKDLRARYDEVYDTLRSIATGPIMAAATSPAAPPG